MTPEGPPSPDDPPRAQAVPDLLDRHLPPSSPLRASLAHLDWAGFLPASAAPGYVYLAASCRGVPVGGGGLTPAEAAARCAGEATEVLVQSAPQPRSTDPPRDAIDALWLAEAHRATAPRIRAFSLTDQTPIGVPAAAVHPDLARADHAPPASLGLAAAADPAAARTAALLELVERDAAARWWMGRELPPALAAADLPARALAAARDGAARPRPTWFARLCGPTGIPAICAASRDAQGERGLAFGFKAGFDARAAAYGALMELLQMEIALEIARHRAARGLAGPGDAGPLARAALDPDAYAAFACRPPRSETIETVDLGGLVLRLAALGMEPVVVDLAGPPGGLATAKAFVAGLRPMPGGVLRPDAGAPGAKAVLM